MRTCGYLFLLLICINQGCNQRNNGDPYNTDKFQKDTTLLKKTIHDYVIADNKDFSTIKVNDENFLTPISAIDYSTIVDSAWYIPLETNRECAISIIDNVIFHKDHIFITDLLTRELYKFTIEGTFVTEIGRKGRGPEEYQNLSHFEIENDEILVWDGRSSRILYYDLNGTFLRHHSIELRMSQFARINDTLIVADIATRGNFHLPEIANSKLIFFNNEWKIVGKADQYDAVNESELSFAWRVLANSSEGVIYNPSISNYIYSIDSSQIRKKYYIDFGDMSLPEGYCNKETNEGFLSKYENSKYAYITTVVETQDNLILQISWNNIPFISFYSKNSGNFKVSQYSRPSPFYPVAILNLHGQVNNRILGSIEPLRVIQFLHENDYPEVTLDPIVRQVFENVNSEDNPILVLLKLKNF